MMVKCLKCGKDNRDSRYFCAKCGAFLRADEVNEKGLVALPELKMMRILENLKEIPHSQIIWDSVVDNYVTNIEKYRALYEIDDIKENHNSEMAREMEVFLNHCRTSEFQIAFVGTIKTGKSTLINALLGKNYASMSVTPETAALTKFRSSEKDYIKVNFYNTKEWDKLWKSMSSGADKFKEEYEKLHADQQKDKWIGHDEIIQFVKNADIEEKLKPWTSSQFPEHYFVKEVEVGISNLPHEFPSQVVFVDTPGLSDPVAYRSEITKKYIRRANAVFVCVEAQKLQQAELETLLSVFSFSKHNKKKVHIIATHWDTLNHPEENWEEQRNYMYDQLTGKDCYDTREMAEANITYSSAYIHNLCRDYPLLSQDAQDKAKIPMMKFLINYVGILGNDVFSKPESFLDFMIEKANIPSIYKLMQERLIDNYRDVLSKDLAKEYQDIMHKLKTAVQESRVIKKNLLHTAQSDLVERRKQLSEHEKACSEIRRCQEQLQAYIENVDARTKKNLSKILAAMDAPPNPNYLKKGKKLYDEALGKVKKVFWGK